MDGTAVKLGFGVLGGIVSWMVGGLGLAFVILLGLMAADYITGLMVGYVNKELSSRKGIKGLLKKTYVIILIGAVYAVEISVIGSKGMLGDGIVVAYIVIEFLSIVENGGKLGAPIGPLKNVIAVLKQKDVDSK